MSNNASLLAVAAEILLLIVDLAVTTVAGAETEEVLLCPFFTSFVPPFDYIK